METNSVDALKDVLHVLRLKPQGFCHAPLASPWGFSNTVLNGAALHLVEHGECWLRMANRAPMHLSAGDVIIVSNTPQYELLDSLTRESIPLRSLLKYRNERDIISLDPGATAAATTLICTEFRPEQNVTYPLFALLPSLIYVKNQGGHAVDWLTTALQFISAEAQDCRPGYETVISRLMDVLFVLVVRYWIDHHVSESGGWLNALYDPQIGTVLSLMHHQPGDDAWTLEKLAQAAYMSRSAFAAHFTAMVGQAPMKYMTRWRIQLATVWLTDDLNVTLDYIAGQLGYASAYAFSKAFKRVVGISPDEYRNNSLHQRETSV